jgi:hypothetical protein
VYTQFEVVCQFFIAYYDENGTYVDNMSTVARQYVGQINAFWFDLGTSLPWSYLDLYADAVRSEHGSEYRRYDGCCDAWLAV